MIETDSINELYRDDHVVKIIKPDLFIKIAGSSFPHGRIADATYSKLPRHDLADVATIAIDNGGIILGRGFNLVLGMGSSGKTTYLNKLRSLTGWPVVKFFEPDPDSATSLDEFCETIHNFIGDVNSGEGLLIDSMKALVYTRGNLSKGGVNVSALQEMSNLSAVAARAGKVIVGAMNLTTDDREVYEAYSEAAVSSINGLINLTTKGSARYRVRDYMSGERHDFTRLWTPNTDTPFVGDVDNKTVISTSVNTDWDDALGRATRSLHPSVLA